MTAPGPFTDVAYLLLAPGSPVSGSGARPPSLGTWPGTERWTVEDPALVKRGPDGAKLATKPAAFTTVVRFARPPERMEDVRRAIEGSLDVRQSALVLGREWIAVEGGGEELAAAFIRRRSDLSVAKMQWLWSESTSRSPGRYGVGTVRSTWTRSRRPPPTRNSGFDDPELDGIALISFADAATLTATRNSDAVVDATRDEAAVPRSPTLFVRDSRTGIDGRTLDMTSLNRTTDLTGRVALVTGGGSGIGAASAQALAGLGARVAVTDIDAAAAETVAAEITAVGGRARALQLDVADEAAWIDAVADVASGWGSVTILHSNAAPTRRGLHEPRSRRGERRRGSLATDPRRSAHRRNARLQAHRARHARERRWVDHHHVVGKRLHRQHAPQRLQLVKGGP